MEINLLSNKHHLLSSLISQLRDKATEQQKFRSLLRTIGMLFAYEIANSFEYKKTSILTPMNATCAGLELNSATLIVSSFEDANYFAAGMGDTLPNAIHGKIEAPRKIIDGKWKAPVQRVEFPLDIPRECDVIVAKTILASGCTATALIGEILKIIKPHTITVAAIVSHQQSCQEIYDEYPYVQINYVIGELDPILDSNGYVIPGLGNVAARIGSS